MSKQEVIKFSKRFLKWVTDKYSGNEIAAKSYCRKKWKQYGYQKLNKALKQRDCTTLTKLEIYLNQIKKHEKNNKGTI